MAKVDVDARAYTPLHQVDEQNDPDHIAKSDAHKTHKDHGIMNKNKRKYI